MVLEQSTVRTVWRAGTSVHARLAFERLDALFTLREESFVGHDAVKLILYKPAVSLHVIYDALLVLLVSLSFKFFFALWAKLGLESVPNLVLG